MKSQNKILKEKFLLDFSQDTVVCFIIMFLYWDIKILKSRTVQELCSHTHTHTHAFIFASFSYYSNSPKQACLNFSGILLNLNVKKLLIFCSKR